ncbi:hypothetical protein V7S43_009417 [Phytophthora oleae]|uniref:BZIP domain-containing protein n=1 Tax=Phytophthora oleae TaxID=2107226 RepID=A0ABD3FIJ8_9STRA
MEHLLNDAPEEAEEMAVKNETTLAPVRAPLVSDAPLPHLAAQLSTVSAASPSSSAASLGLHMLAASRPAPPRLPPISLLTAAAAALQPMQCQPMQCQPMQVQATPQPQLRPVMTTPVLATPEPASQTASPTDEMLCRYRNKKCGYPRAIKRNGERHNLCERHRAKANQNQRKLESKRRTQKRMMQRASNALGADRIVKAKKATASAETEIKFKLYGGAAA